MESQLAEVVAMLLGCPDGVPVKRLAQQYSMTYHKNLTVASLGFSSVGQLLASLDGELAVEGELVFHRSHRPPGAAVDRVRCAPPEAAEDEGGPDTGHGQPGKARKRRDREERGASPALLAAGLPPEPVGVSFGAPTLLESSSMGSVPSVGVSPAPPTAPAGRAAPEGTEKLSQDQLLQRVTEAMKADKFAGGSMVRLASCYTELYGEDLPLDQYMLLYDSWESKSPGKARRSRRTLKSEAPTLPSTSSVTTPKKSKKKETKLSTYLPSVSLPSVSLPSGSLPSGFLRSVSPLSVTPPSVSLPSVSLPSVSLPSGSLPSGSMATGFMPSGPSDKDFPSLGTAKPKEPPRWSTPTRRRPEEEEDEEEEQRRRNAPVFMDSYHAQLRQVHGANMRAVEALEEDNKDGRSRNRALDAETVNTLVEGVIRDLATGGELVTQEKVVSKACRLMQVTSLRAVGIHQAWHIPALKDLQYTIREINMFLESTQMASGICTLYELGRSLAGLKDKKSYEELNLGPLCQMPIVHRMFKIDSGTKDDEIHQIETVDILKSLRVFRRKHCKQKVDLADFMKYLADQHRCDSPYELGVRITSVGLPIATLSKVSRCEHQYIEQAQRLIQKELEEEVLERMRQVKRSVMDPFSSSSGLELRKKYASMAASEVVLEVFNHIGEIFSSRLNKVAQDFLLQVSGDRLSTALFQLAICGGSLAAPLDLVAKQQPAKAAGKPAKDQPALELPSEDAVKQFLKDTLSNQSTALTLAQMASLEKKLSRHFKIPEFGSLHRGTFLDFLVKHVQLLQETVGGTVVLGGGSGGVELQAGGFRPSRQDVFEFIKQCGSFSSTEPDALVHVERALRVHYGVRDSRDLGFGPLPKLADLVKRQRDILGGGGCAQVHYETALFAKHGGYSDVLTYTGCNALVICYEWLS